MEKENVLFELKKNIQEDKLIKIVFSDRQSGDFKENIKAVHDYPDFLTDKN